jgi:hypothetical protein
VRGVGGTAFARASPLSTFGTMHGSSLELPQELRLQSPDVARRGEARRGFYRSASIVASNSAVVEVSWNMKHGRLFDGRRWHPASAELMCEKQTRFGPASQKTQHYPPPIEGLGRILRELNETAAVGEALNGEYAS